MCKVRIIDLLFFYAVISTALFVNPAHAEVRPTYSKTTIMEWEPEFRAAIQENYTRMFLPKLSNEEAQKLQKIRFEFPTDPDKVLFDFYTRHQDGTIVFPVASLLFLKDLASAQAWLLQSKYSGQTVLDYLAVIRQGRLADWPEADRLPLQALGIPAEALKEPSVMERRNDILNKTIFFILGHELGHQINGPCSLIKPDIPCAFKEKQKNESDADAFAVDMFRRMGLVPSASNFFFALNSRLSRMPFEFNNGLEWQQYANGRTHPLDSARINNVAELIDDKQDAFAHAFSSPEAGKLLVKSSVNELRSLANWISDRDLSGMQIAWAKSLEPEDIKPRQSDEPQLRPTKVDLAATQPLAGYFTGEAKFSNGGNAPLEVIMRLQGSSPQITGEVMLGGIRGRVEGQQSDPKHANATWIVTGDTYRLTMDANSTVGHLNAAYKSTTDKAVTGQWALERKRQ